jgi:uncharacterized membrane protein YdjX (TVP38/TMEM64 family)
LAPAAAFAAFWFATGHHLDIVGLTPEEARRYIRAWGAWAAVGAVALMVLHSFLPLPAEVIAMGNGMIFGPWLGMALTWTGAMIGAILSFVLARGLGRPLVRWALPERHWQRLDTVPTRPRTLLLVRLLPVISFNLVNYAAGILHVGWWTFLWTTAIGILPLTIVMSFLGKEMMSAPWWIWVVVTGAILGLWLLLRGSDRTAA